MRLLCLTHVPFEGPAGIADWARARGHRMELVRCDRAADYPGPGSFDWLVVMGGPMGVGDAAIHPWLDPEKAFIRHCISAGRTLVGVCLGAQLIAEALGAPVYRNPEKEIGWMPIELTEEGRDSGLFGFLAPRLDVFHWHGDTFDLPSGAIHLARSAACANQAFLWDGRVLGLQFHLESTPASVRDILTHCADELVAAPHVQSVERILAATPADYERINGALFGILDRLDSGAT